MKFICDGRLKDKRVCGAEFKDLGPYLAHIQEHNQRLALEAHGTVYLEGLMPRYYVVTPIYEQVAAELWGDAPHPAEEGCDVLLVDAPSPRKAKSAAVKYWRKHHGGLPWSSRNWVAKQVEDGKCPYTGLKVELEEGVNVRPDDEYVDAREP